MMMWEARYDAPFAVLVNVLGCLIILLYGVPRACMRCDAMRV